VDAGQDGVARRTCQFVTGNVRSGKLPAEIDLLTLGAGGVSKERHKEIVQFAISRASC